MTAPAPLPSLRLPLSRRSAIFGAVTLAAAPATVAPAAPRWDGDLVALEARLRTVMDGARRALEPVPDDERPAHNDRLDGSDTSAADRHAASKVRDAMLEGIPAAVEPAFPGLDWFNGLTPAWALRCVALDLGLVRVKGHAGRRAVRLQGHETLLIREGRAWVELAGARDVAGPDDPADWLFWTVPQVDALRRQRHPEQFPVG